MSQPMRVCRTKKSCKPVVKTARPNVVCVRRTAHGPSLVSAHPAVNAILTTPDLRPVVCVGRNSRLATMTASGKILLPAVVKASVIPTNQILLAVHPDAMTH